MSLDRHGAAEELPALKTNWMIDVILFPKQGFSPGTVTSEGNHFHWRDQHLNEGSGTFSYSSRVSNHWALCPKIWELCTNVFGHLVQPNDEAQKELVKPVC